MSEYNLPDYEEDVINRIIHSPLLVCKWVNSNHILPDNKEEVLIHLSNGRNVVGYLRENEYIDLWYSADGLPIAYVNDTWWMIIPKVPE